MNDTPSNPPQTPVESPAGAPAGASVEAEMRAELDRMKSQVAELTAARPGEAELKREFVRRCKDAAVKEHLGGQKELAQLLPDVADPALMAKAAQQLRHKLNSLHPPLPALNRNPDRPPSPEALIAYGLELRKRNRH